MSDLKEELIKCDSKCDAALFLEENELLVKLSEQYPDNVEILWRLSRSWYNIGELSEKDVERQKECFQKSMDCVKKALTLNTEHYAVHKWYAVAISAISKFLPNKERIKDAYVIKEHAMKSAELNPLDATTQYILGKWCFNIAAIDFVTRTAASLFFATPPTSSYEEALGYFMKSEELNPNNIRNRLMIGDTYTAMGQTDKAKEWYKKASETPTTGETEKALLEEAKTKMNQKSGWFY